MIDSFLLQGMMPGHKNTYDCIRAFWEIDFTEDLKRFDLHGAATGLFLVSAVWEGALSTAAGSSALHASEEAKLENRNKTSL